MLQSASGGYSLHAGVLIGAALPGDRVRIQLKRPWSDGSTALELTAEELAERPVAPAGVGVRLRKAGTGSSRWTPWSVLLWRVFGVNGLACPTCGKVMVLRAEVRPPATLSVLASLEWSARGPPGAEAGTAGA